MGVSAFRVTALSARRDAGLSALGTMLLALTVVASPTPPLSAAPAPSPSPCAEATTTLAMTECLVEEIRRSDAAMERYLKAARVRLERERREAARDPRQERPAIDLAATQSLWQAYRRAHCGDLAERWRGASLRPVVAGECLLRLGRQRTRELWSAYLTFPDGTPPLLPDPETPAAARPSP